MGIFDVFSMGVRVNKSRYCNSYDGTKNNFAKLKRFSGIFHLPTSVVLLLWGF